MSFTSKYESVNIAAEDGRVRDALVARTEAAGWSVIDNKERIAQGLDPVMVRAHNNENKQQYDLVIKSPGEGYYDYDIGANVVKEKNEEGKEVESCQITYDSYHGEIEKVWGKNCIQLKKEVIVEAVRLGHNQQMQDAYDFESFVGKFVTGPDGKEMSADELKDTENLLLNTMEDPLVMGAY